MKRLYIANLPYSMDSDDLREMFAHHGIQVLEATVIFNGDVSCGYGFAQVEEADFRRALDLDKTSWEGRCLHIAEAAPRPLRSWR